MFTGSYQHTIDKKYRLILPASWRDDLGRVVVITLGMTDIRNGRCLSLMSAAEFEQYARMFDNIPTTDVRGTNMKRALLGNTFRIEVDSQGRVLMPQTLRSIAKIDENVVLVGMQNSIEIWNAETWDNNTNAYLNDPDVWLEGISALAGGAHE